MKQDERLSLRHVRTGLRELIDTYNTVNFGHVGSIEL